MSPVVQRQRVESAQSGSSSDEHWSVLLFESLSVGTIMVLLVMLASIFLVGVYVIVVWPLTFWDLTNSGLERYGSWAKTALWSIFAGGSVAGYWCISGAAFRGKRSRREPNSTPRAKIE